MRYEDVKAGDRLPQLTKKPGVTDLVKFAAGGGDFNPLHHDYDYRESKALGGIIVFGRYKYQCLGELVSNWLDHEGRVKKISCQFRGIDFPDKPLHFEGEVVKVWEEDGEKLAELKVWCENGEGKVTTPGGAVVVFH